MMRRTRSAVVLGLKARIREAIGGRVIDLRAPAPSY
jgi:hypothetical protein